MNHRPLVATKEIVNKRNNIYMILNGIDIWALNLTQSYLLIKIQHNQLRFPLNIIFCLLLIFLPSYPSQIKTTSS